jgi:HAMP domain-containing protein
MSLKLKFSLYVTFIIIVILASVSGVLIRLRTAEIQRDLIARDKLIALNIIPDLSDDIANFYYYQFDTYVETIKNRLHEFPELLQIRVYNTDNQLMFDTIEIQAGKYQGTRVSSDPTVISVIKSKKLSQTLSHLNGEDTIRIITPFIDKYGVFRLVVEFQFSMKQVRESIQQVVQTFAILLGIFTSLGILVTVIFIDRFTKPISLLTKAAQEISKGNLDLSVKTKADDEVGILANSFNKMTEDLKKSKEELLKYNQELESQVRARTQELASKIDDLERLQKITINREVRMIELKEKLKKYEAKKA